MIDYKLKSKLDRAFALADEAGESMPEIRERTGMTLREILKADLLKLCGFLFESDGSTVREEVAYLKDYLGVDMDVSQFLRFRYDKCMDKSFINTVPQCLMYFAKYDLTAMKGGAVVRSTAKEVVETLNDFGAGFVAVNGESVTEIGNLSNYYLMMNKFLKEYGLYYTQKGATTFASGRKEAAGTAKSTAESSVGAAGSGSSAKGTEKSAEEDEKTLDDYMEELDSLVGLKSVKQDLTNLINLVKVRQLRKDRGMRQPDITLHLVFSGNPGTGKTTVARLLAKIYKSLGVVSQGQLIEVDRSKLVAGFVGQTAAQTAEVVESAKGGILFIDEAYTLIKKGDEKDFGQEAVDTLLKLMEDNRDDLIVIVAGYTDKMEEFVNSNPGLKSRFNKYIFFNDYTGDELFAIFKSMCKKQEYEPDEEASEYIHAYLTRRARAGEENFANGREVRNYIERCIERQASRIVDIKDISDEELRTLRLADVTEETDKGVGKASADGGADASANDPGSRTGEDTSDEA